MKKLLLILLCMLFAVQVFAQETAEINAAETSAEETKAAETNTETEKAESPKEQTSDVKTNAKGKPDFNKKKISLDRIDEKKWSLRVGYNYFMPDSKYLKMFQNKLKIGGSYDFNKNFQVQAFLQYADGKNNFDISGTSVQFKGTVYNIGVLATGLYPVELSLGSIAPFGSIGAAYTFGNLNTIQNGVESKQNLSGGAVLAQAGLQYSYHILSVRVFGEYLYDFTPLNNPYISALSGFSIGAELGIKF